MSDVCAIVARVNEVEQHPNADRLEVVQVLGTQTVVPKDTFHVGQQVVYFPPDLLLPGDVSARLGVTNYLKHAVYPGEMEKSQCRVAACRLRGEPSHGFIIPCPSLFLLLELGTDVSCDFNAVKYEPPQPTRMAGDVLPEVDNFPRYTDIENFWRFPDAIPAGTLVSVTEKIHGTNCRFGKVKIGDSWELVAGSHNVRLKPEPANIYWAALYLPNVLKMVEGLCQDQHDIVVYGEIYGPGIQDLDYGMPQGQQGFLVFDILRDGRFLNRGDLHIVCKAIYGVQTVPLLWFGEYDPGTVPTWAEGPTHLAEEVRSTFKGREGVVITPLFESCSHTLGGRMILKSKSADYLDRKGAQDNA